MGRAFLLVETFCGMKWIGEESDKCVQKANARVLIHGHKMNYITLDEIKTLAHNAGLGINILACLTNNLPSRFLQHQKHLETWQREGFAGQMHYMQRPPLLFTDLENLLPSVKSVLFVAAYYSQEPAPRRLHGYGRVARYAWGLDYHTVLKEKLNALVEVIERHLNKKISYRIFSDAVPLLERALACDAGLGFIGKNTLLIQRGLGSYFFISEILWDVECQESAGVLGTCGTCTRCQTNCPTNALVSDFKLDARKCISYLSIEKRGSLETWERTALGEWVFGCDICQEVCPFNHKALRLNRHASFDEFMSERGVGANLDLVNLLRIRTEQEFRARFGQTALRRTKRAGLLRNAACVAANTKAENVIPSLIEALMDSDSIVRQHVAWSLSRLAPTSATKLLLEKLRKDPEENVKMEVETILDHFYDR